MDWICTLSTIVEGHLWQLCCDLSLNEIIRRMETIEAAMNAKTGI